MPSLRCPSKIFIALFLRKSEKTTGKMGSEVHEFCPTNIFSDFNYFHILAGLHFTLPSTEGKYFVTANRSTVNV